MTEPILHPRTKQQLQAALRQPPHALVLSGSIGMGKEHVALWLAAELVGAKDIANFPYLHVVRPEAGKAITIEQIRQLIASTTLTVPGAQAVSRLGIIIDAHTMTVEAQNALLKTLEEPPTGTVLLMTSAQPQALLPTIRSRAQTIELLKPPLSQLAPHASAQQLKLSDGLPGLTFALAAEDQEHPLVQAAGIARELLAASAFNRLTQIEKIVKDKAMISSLLLIMSHMAHAALLTGKNSARWQKVAQATHQAQLDQRAGVQPKLLLTTFMLSL